MEDEGGKQRSRTTWEGYYRWQEGREPRPLLKEVLATFDAADGGYRDGGTFQRQAIDLGCGEGTETLALLEAGWRVLAIDREPAAISHVRAKVTAALVPGLETMTASFEELRLPEADLVYAGFSLPFCRPEHFDGLWATVIACIRPGGRFAGQLFGDRDSWAGNRELTFHTAGEVGRLLQRDFEIEVLREVEEEGQAYSGPKHWHVFDVIARKWR